MYDRVYTVIDTAHSTFMGFTKKCKEVSWCLLFIAFLSLCYVIKYSSTQKESARLHMQFLKNLGLLGGLLLVLLEKNR